MNQESNNFNVNNFNTQGNNGITNNQPLNNQSFNNTVNPNVVQNQNGSVSTFNTQQMLEPISPVQPQPAPSYEQPIINEPTSQPKNTFDSGNASNKNFNSKPPKKMNLGLIIGIVVVIAVVGVGIVFGSKLLSNSDSNENNNGDNNNSTIQQNNNSSTNNDVEIIYFDVVEGKKCNESDYNTSNSKNGYNGIINRDNNNAVLSKEDNQTSCLRFFVLDESDNTKCLLLDHNTSEYTYWNASGSTNGPGLKSSNELKKMNTLSNRHNEVLYNLKEDTNNWVGTEKPKNYSYSSYEINYSDFKARLPQFEEIVAAGEISVWVKENELGFFGGELTTELSEYWWLYDNLDGCEYYGCKYEDKSTRHDNGYWTANSSGASYALEVPYTGGINARSSSYTNAVRPVIEVLKSKLN